MARPTLEILAYEPTPLGLLCLRRRELPGAPGTSVTEITLDHEFLMSSHLTASEEALARVALDLHPGRDLDVLVGGLGLGYTAHAALASPRVARVEVVEFLPQVIDWLTRGLVPLSGALRADPRLVVVRGDVYARLLAPPSRTHDLVLIDVDHSPDEPLSRGATGPAAGFHGDAGLACAKRHLAPGGVLAVWSSVEHSPFVDALRRVFASVRAEPVTIVNDLIDEEQTDWLFFASD
ncbi:MAG: spermidine synthase [Planctomycetia bacterium]|nr:spermidine synthase [Planctomycetia bacterium]